MGVRSLLRSQTPRGITSRGPRSDTSGGRLRVVLGVRCYLQTPPRTAGLSGQPVLTACERGLNGTSAGASVSRGIRLPGHPSAGAPSQRGWKARLPQDPLRGAGAACPSSEPGQPLWSSFSLLFRDRWGPLDSGDVPQEESVEPIGISLKEARHCVKLWITGASSVALSASWLPALAPALCYLSLEGC